MENRRWKMIKLFRKLFGIVKYKHYLLIVKENDKPIIIPYKGMNVLPTMFIIDNIEYYVTGVVDEIKNKNIINRYIKLELTN